MAYQSFDGEKADSKSAEKLTRIRLPDSLADKALLDIGCNEGFFCNAAVKRGATRVVGIDANEKIIESSAHQNAGSRVSCIVVVEPSRRTVRLHSLSIGNSL